MSITAPPSAAATAHPPYRKIGMLVSGVAAGWLVAHLATLALDVRKMLRGVGHDPLTLAEIALPIAAMLIVFVVPSIILVRYGRHVARSPASQRGLEVAGVVMLAIAAVVSALFLAHYVRYAVGVEAGYLRREPKDDPILMGLIVNLGLLPSWGLAAWLVHLGRRPVQRDA